ncbi:MAG: N(G),N(G)-dimethylarginine dimethylaminohydrolase [Spirochaetales bacterium]|jgi:dimethylargininase|nr:N(G),N(G)-dimethylarginine dimethylaminohydrolase [Spirochaetales bacterium]
MFSKAIVRTPGESIVYGLTTCDLGIPDYNKALIQHEKYVDILQKCGLDVTVLEADEKYPDSTFVEDTALLTPHCAIITNPGAPSRKGEILKMKHVASQFFSVVEEIKDPGTVEAGDIMMVGDHYYIGLSERTNENGAGQVIEILEKYGMTGSTIKVEKVLHLKTGSAYIERNNLLVCGEFISVPDFGAFNTIIVPEKESYASNCIWINDTVVIPAGFPITKKNISELGYNLVEAEMTEFEKVDGGLSCLSLRS